VVDRAGLVRHKREKIPDENKGKEEFEKMHEHLNLFGQIHGGPF
jgi:hypothetical protein